MTEISTPRYRRIALGSREVVADHLADGSILVRATEPLAPYPRLLTERLAEVARDFPDRVFLAVRDDAAPGRWRELRYADAWERVQRIGQALLDRGLSQQRPVAILSGSGIEHALLALGAMHVGIPSCAVTPAYSLLSTDHVKLAHVIGLLKPGLVFVDDGTAFGNAIESTVGPDVEIVHSTQPAALRSSTPFAELLATATTPAVEAASRAVEPDSVAKVLFTSGSTGLPKGVVNTQRMVACNQQMFVQSFPCLAEEPPVILSWLPWHHVSGGNQMLGLTIHCAGSFYVDDGKPLPAEVEKTVANLHQIAPTVYFSVPRGFAALIPFLRADEALRRKFFSRLSLLYYSGSALGASLVRDLDELAVQAVGERIPMMSGYGATETAPAAVAANWITERTGLAGLPMPGCELKLAPLGSGKYEARLRGPNVTPGYWAQPELSARLFDDEGFACMGDALSFVVPGDVAQGFAFDGRIAEDFKLTTGTWVGAGTLRARLIEEGDGLLLDAVIAGEGHDEVGAFLVADRAVAAACCGLASDGPWPEVLAHPRLRARVQQVLDRLAARGTGSSTFVARALVLEDGPSAAAGELTDKGSINQRAFLSNRNELVARLYTEPSAPEVYRARTAASLQSTV
ncbi:Feruloyl-CoA synthase [Burkholderiales bacterium 8X]|nr:Feruloyl-CoA synthase [Burkholderiales bacterium 8X]